jgi:hypothetical protein
VQGTSRGLLKDYRQVSVIVSLSSSSATAETKELLHSNVTERVRVLFVLCATVQPDRQRKEQLFRTGVFRQLSTAGSDLTGRYNDRT